jgi:hypothetical protein
VNDPRDDGSASIISRKEAGHRWTVVIQLVKAESRQRDAIVPTMVGRQQTYPVKHTLKAIAQIVDNNNVVTFFEKLQRGMGADIAKSTNHHDIFFAIILGTGFDLSECANGRGRRCGGVSSVRAERSTRLRQRRKRRTRRARQATHLGRCCKVL